MVDHGRLMSSQQLEVEREVAEAGFDLSCFAWRESHGDPFPHAVRCSVYTYVPSVSREERFFAAFASDNRAGGFYCHFSPGMLARDETERHSSWGGVVSAVSSWASYVKRELEAMALLDIIEAARATSHADGAKISVQSAAGVVKLLHAAHETPADAVPPSTRGDLDAIVIAFARTLGTRLDSKDARDSTRHAELLSALNGVEVELRALRDAAGRLGLKDLLNNGLGLVLQLLVSAYVLPKDVQLLVDQLVAALQNATSLGR
jgi:hypothetical protein